MSTYTHREDLFIAVPAKELQRVFPAFWKSVIGSPINRPFAGESPERVEDGVFKQVKGSLRNPIETTITFRPAVGGSVVTYERTWQTTLPTGSWLTRKMVGSLFGSWHEMLVDYCKQLHGREVA